MVLLAGLSKKQVSSETAAPPVSVIICAHDEEINLQELVPQLLAQDYPEFEVLVVDDRSNDNTFDWLLQETKKDHRLRMVRVNRTPPHLNGKKYALTLGIKTAKYEWLLLTDADCRPAGNGWIREMAVNMQATTRFVLGFSPYQRRRGLLNLLIRFDTLITAIQYFAYAKLGNPYMGVGRNLAYRKSLFLEDKGFVNHQNITGGDDDLYVNEHARRANTKVCMQPAAAMTSVPKTAWLDFLAQKHRHLSVGKFYRRGHRLLLGIFTVTWLFTWVLALALFVLQIQPLWVGVALFVHALTVGICVGLSANRLGQRFEWWATPLLDFIYAFYYLVTGLMALVFKKVRWKKN